MKWFKTSITMRTTGKGLSDISAELNAALRSSGITEGMCWLYMPHCSASLVIQETYDPSARRDMETFLEKVVPENQPWMTHMLEGADDSSAHLRAMLLPTSLTIPIEQGALALGQWQGVYLVEHRRGTRQREVWLRAMDGGQMMSDD